VLSVTKATVIRCLGTELRPTRLRIILKMVKNSRCYIGDYLYDLLRFARHSSTFRYATRESLASKIMATCHAVERGLALPDPRPGFGEKNIAYLLEAIDEYIRRFGIDSSLCPSTGALIAYLKFNESQGIPDCVNRAKIERSLQRLAPVWSEKDGGTIEVTSEAIRRSIAGVSADFFFTRHSIRQFTNDEVSAAEIETAVAIAQKAPAVCNRQECSVYVVHDKLLMRDMLAIQGSRGFNHQINKLLVVTNRLTAFSGTGERNQCWIDGGLFAMSLVLGLHAQGIGTCCLNWSKSASEDRAMRRLLKIRTTEVIIMLVAVGKIPPKFTVTRSFRNSLASACKHIVHRSDM
jgi:nitroreductase